MTSNQSVAILWQVLGHRAVKMMCLVTLATGATVRVRELIKDAMLQPAHQYPELLNTRFG